jgi:hypothetical protein
MKTVDLVYFNAGGGHRASALALETIMREQQRPWNVRLVNLFEVLDPQDRFGQLTGMKPEALYNQRLARGWTLGLAQELKLLQGMIRLGHSMLVRQLQQHWLATEPDMVVSLVPNFNRAMFESLASTLPGVPYVTALTDMADFPPNFWIEQEQAQHYVCGTPRAVEQAREAGIAEACIHATSGMIIRPEFYRMPDIDRDEARRSLGLDAGRPTALVMFGGHGSKAMLGIAKALRDMQLILMCGHNKTLADQLRTLKSEAPHVVIGFTSEMARYMQIADFMIGKPGPGSISEAVQQGLPVIVARNAWTMPQERYNTQWVRENKVGVVCKGFGAIREAVLELTKHLDEFRRNASRIDNRAVFEIPDILAGILNESEGGAATTLAPGHRLVTSAS